MSVKKVHQFRCIPDAFPALLRAFCLSFAFCLAGTRDLRRLRFAWGSLYPRYQRYFSSEAGIFGVGRRPKLRKKNFSLFAFMTWRKPETALVPEEPQIKSPRDFQVPSLQTQTSLIHPIWRLLVRITGRQARGASHLKLASFRRTKVH